MSSMSELIQINALAPLQGTRKTSKVMLLFPPEWVPTAPYLALPSLTAVLREAGHTVIQRDINIGMWDHFFSMEFLIWVKARLGMQLKPLQDKEKAGTLTEQEVDQKAVVEQAYTVDVFDLADRAEDAEADRAWRAFLPGRDTGRRVEHVPRSDGLHFHSLLSRVARLLSDGKQSGLSPRRVQRSVGLFGR